MNRPAGRFTSSAPTEYLRSGIRSGAQPGVAVPRKPKALVFPRKFLASGVYGDAFEDFADFGCQGFQVEGFLQEVHAALQDAVAEDAVVGVAGI